MRKAISAWTAVSGWIPVAAIRVAAIPVAGLLAALPAPAVAQSPNCHTAVSFDRWLADFKKEAAEKGISAAAINAASPYMVYDQRIVNIDRGQRFFSQTFLEFSDKMLPAYRLQTGVAQIRKWQPVFAREEREFGVPPAVITAFWGLESDFGGGQGKDQALKSLTTLAYDCRRSDMFRGHLLDALRIIERGDLRPEEMIGSWAGELGQTQMMPSEYLRDAVDYDGSGRRNLIRSVPDVIGSTGKYLGYLGWKRGEPWLQEVRVPANFKWEEADLSIQHPRAQWVAMGVTLTDGRPLPSDKLPASVVLPMGRFGPTFMAYDNFQVYLKWNNSLMYSLTAAYYATRLDGAAPMRRGSDIPKISFEETRELQQILARRGYDIGRTDGVLGLKSRTAVREMQIKFGLPADSWPTAELLNRLRATR